jgi:hypothetical protein
MPDARRHRGPHPKDGELFAAEAHPALLSAVSDYSWLLTRGYSEVSALKLVGDRYRLLERQRTAVMRCSCSDQALARRTVHRVEADALRGAAVEIDGFNVLTTVEAALAGGVLLAGRDGCLRDMASMHGSWRKVAETRPAAEIAGRFLHECGAASCRWLLDSPVSNSGRLSQLLRDVATENGWPWNVETVPSPDAVLAVSNEIVLTADSAILDRCGRWFNAGAALVASVGASIDVDCRDAVVSGSEAVLPPGRP